MWFTCLVALGCSSEREPSGEAKQAEPPARSEPEKPVELPAQPPAEPEPKPKPDPAPRFDAKLGERFVVAAAKLASNPADARELAPSWRAPDCKLQYEFRMEVGNADTSAPTSRMLIAGSWTASAKAPGMILKNGEIGIGQVAGPMRQAVATPAGSFAEIRLQTDGRSWTEIDGPTTLWSAYGSWIGLTTFYPALPESGAPGSSVDWTLQFFDRSAGGRVEAERGSLEVPDDVELPKPEPTTRTPRVTLERWIEVGGKPAAVFRSWSEIDELDAEVPDEPRVHEISQGQYVVLESGELLHAELIERAKYRIGTGEQAVEYDIATEGEARLVRGCGGPVLTPPDDAKPAAE
jgi:hypothetical protein